MRLWRQHTEENQQSVGVTVKIGEFEYLWTHCGTQMVFLWDAKYGTSRFFMDLPFVIYARSFIQCVAPQHDAFRICVIFVFKDGNTGFSPTVYIIYVSLISRLKVALLLFRNLLFLDVFTVTSPVDEHIATDNITC